jgi:hypothetical protein
MEREIGVACSTTATKQKCYGDFGGKKRRKGTIGRYGHRREIDVKMNLKLI